LLPREGPNEDRVIGLRPQFRGALADLEALNLVCPKRLGAFKRKGKKNGWK